MCKATSNAATRQVILLPTEGIVGSKSTVRTMTAFLESGRCHCHRMAASGGDDWLNLSRLLSVPLPPYVLCYLRRLQRYLIEVFSLTGPLPGTDTALSGLQ